MFENNLNGKQGDERPSVTLRDLLSVGFRQKRLIINTFLGVFSLAVVLAFILPKKYQSEMKILVRHERADNMVTPDREQPMQLRTEVSEEELQSEAELLKSRDLLTKVVLACDLQRTGNHSLWNMLGHKDDEQTSRAVVKLENDLTVQPIKLTNLIGVKYSSKDPQLAARVLNTLASLYLEKHLAIHRAPGEFEFFHQQAEQYRTALMNAENKLTNFSREQGVVNPTLEKEISVRKLAEEEAELKATKANIVEAQERIRKLQAQLGTLPKRQTTQVRTADNPQLMERMKSTLLELELERQRISNVVVAEPASVPFTAQSRWLFVMLLGGLLAVLSSVVLAFAVDYWDPSFRTPEEVESFLGSPVVAAIPRDGD